MIVNLFKTGDVTYTDNYRGLTINSCLAKLFNTVLNNRLVHFLEKNKLICDNQIGFKKKILVQAIIYSLLILFLENIAITTRDCMCVLWISEKHTIKFGERH